MRTHPSRSAYVAGCRCDECRQANVAYETSRQLTNRALNGANLGNYLVPAGPTRRAVRRLTDNGWTQRRIARTAGLDVGTVNRVSNGHRRHVTLGVAERIAALR